MIAMKRILFMAVACIFFAGAAIATPGDNSSTGVAVIRKGSTVSLVYKGTRPGTVKVFIYDSKKKLVFSESLRQETGFKRPYNFFSLAEGNYTIEVIGENGKEIQKVAYWKTETPQFFNVKRVGGSNRYVLSYFGKSADVLKVRILSAEGDELFSETHTIAGDFAKVYRIDSPSPEVTFEITDAAGNVRTISY